MSHRMRTAGALGVVFAATLLLLTGCGRIASPFGFGGESADPIGVWSESSSEESPYLSFSDDGKVSGYDGCNQLGGSWEATADGIEFSDFAATQMFCEGVDTWLTAAASAEISGGEMTVLDGDGKKIGELEQTSTTPVEG